MAHEKHKEALIKMEELDNAGIRFKVLNDYPLYRIYENGIIIKEKGNKYKNSCKILKHTLSKKKYHTVYIYDKNMKGSSQRVHRLVAMAFVDGFSDKNNIVNHINGDKNDNNYTNLEWCDISYNNKHAIETLGVKRYGEYNGSSKLSDNQVLEIMDLAKNGFNYTQIAKMYNVSKTTIARIIKNTSWKHIKKEKLNYE